MMNRQVFLALVFALFHFCCFSQEPSVTLYAYKQGVSPGIRTEPVDETGKLISIPGKTYTNYFIYLTYPADVQVYPAELWISGVRWGVKANAVTELPVEVTYPAGPYPPEKVTLVPSTADKVLLLTPIEDGGQKASSGNPALIKENELVVVYRMRGKMYSKAMKAITALRAQALP